LSPLTPVRKGFEQKIAKTAKLAKKRSGAKKGIVFTEGNEANEEFP
jgi:hypothetical protein